MRDWQQSHGSYYADFIITPVFIITTALLTLPFRKSAAGLAVGVVVGLLVWTLAEYWIHRALFHHVFKRAHDLHHVRPRGFDAAPWYITATLQAALAIVLIGLFDWSLGAGLFLGLDIGYFAYITLHDQIHHGRKARSGTLQRLARAHAIHHRGVEKNFGVVTGLWDRIFGTYDPR